MRDKRYQSTEKGLNDLADLMLGRINSCVDDKAKKNVKIKSATVTKVNEDGTVNVSLPDDGGNGFSRIQNQSVYELSVGDSVEIMLKEGSFSNCWVIAKHGGGSKRVNLVNSGSIPVTNTGGTSGGSGSDSDSGGKIGGMTYGKDINRTTHVIYDNPEYWATVDAVTVEKGATYTLRMDATWSWCYAFDNSDNYVSDVFIGSGNYPQEYTFTAPTSKIRYGCYDPRKFLSYCTLTKVNRSDDNSDGDSDKATSDDVQEAHLRWLKKYFQIDLILT